MVLREMVLIYKMNKKEFRLFFVLGLFIALLQSVIVSINGDSPELKLIEVLVLAIVWSLGLFSVWNLAKDIIKHLQNRDNNYSWSTFEKGGVFLQLLSVPVILIIDMIIAQSFNVIAYLFLMWCYRIIIIGALLYVGRKIYHLGNPVLGVANIFWGFALIFYFLGLSFL